MSNFVIKNLPLNGAKLLCRKQAGDSRGFLSRVFCSNELSSVGWDAPVVQINHTYTAKTGTVRGMHFQHAPCAEKKLVTCVRGSILDVIIDIRFGSRTFLQWHAEKITAGNLFTILIPEGFAHGFQALTDDVELLYCHSSPYSPSSEDGLNPTDPILRINWPLPISEISGKDIKRSMINSKFQGISI